jgi:hypothetical protein
VVSRERVLISPCELILNFRFLNQSTIPWNCRFSIYLQRTRSFKTIFLHALEEDSEI